MCGLGRSLYNSLMVACGDEVVVVAAHNVAAIDDVAAANDFSAADDVTAADGFAAGDGVVVAVGATAVIDVRVQQCWMRACKNPQSHLVSAVVTLRGNNLSW